MEEEENQNVPRAKRVKSRLYGRNWETTTPPWQWYFHCFQIACFVFQLMYKVRADIADNKIRQN
jgi:hypothetical protein